MQKSSTLKKLSYNGFDGIDTRKCHSGEKNIYDIVNFQITDDGSLKKRYGARPLIKGIGNIVAVWSGMLDGKQVYFYVSNKNLVRLTLPAGSSSMICTLEAYTGTPRFFHYKNSLYLFTSAGFYKVSYNTATPVIGYVPLFGKDWGTTVDGAVNEPLNILNDYGRISYVVEEQYSSMFGAGRPIKSIVSVYKNGVLLASDEYRKDSTYDAIIIPEIKPGDRILATYEYEANPLREELFSCTSSDVFGSINNSRIFIWGGTSAADMFGCASVSSEAAMEAQSFFENDLCASLYFPEDGKFTVGEGRYAVKGIARHYDRLLIFTEGDTWMADSDECQNERVPVMNINTHVGCSSNGAVSSIGNDPITVWKNAVYRWSAETDELNECNAYPISNDISGMVPQSFFNKAMIYKTSNNKELWFYNTSSSTVWVYNVSKSAWTKFSNIYAKGFFDINGNVAFFYGNTFFTFSSGNFVDQDENYNSTAIVATLTIKNIDFGTPYKKRLDYCTVCGEMTTGEANTGNINLQFIYDNGDMLETNVTQDKNHKKCYKRLSSARFCSLAEIRVTADAENNTRQTIHSLEISAR